MRWLLAGLSFAMAVALAVGTAAVRVENAHYRRAAELAYRDCVDRWMELRRLAVERLEEGKPERLAERLWRQVAAEAGRRQEQLQ